MSERPIRIQRKRAKGWRMPENTVYVGRPTMWGNPFRVGDGGNKLAVDAFRYAVAQECGWVPIPLPWPSNERPPQFTTLEDVKRQLKGKNLACFCRLDQPCHADVLLEIANS